jgi:hypothetical protein
MILLFRSYDYFSSFIYVHLVLSARNADEIRNQCRRDGSKASSSSCAGQQQVLGRLPWEPSQVAKRTKYCASFRRGLMYMCLFLAHSRTSYIPSSAVPLISFTIRWKYETPLQVSFEGRGKLADSIAFTHVGSSLIRRRGCSTVCDHGILPSAFT